MSVNLDKNREKIVTAWKDVLDDKTATDWALFGYEAQSNDIKVVATGDGGLDELTDDLNSGKIMYAFVRIPDLKTGLTKFLLINWQGEGAPVLRKGTCANHIHDVAKVLTGAHLTVNARVEDDIDKERIMKNVTATNSTYSFKEPRAVQEEQKTPVGTNYNRVIPARDLNTTEMQNFWKKEEEEERRRVELEKERKRLNLIKREEEQRSREEKEHKERERLIAENTKLQPAHVPIKTSPQPLSPVKSLGSPTRVMTEAERMRQQRSQEARDLIGSRVGTAKAIFTQNTSDGQMQTKTAAPAKPVRNSIAQRINALNNPQQPEQKQESKPVTKPIMAEPIVEEEQPSVPVMVEPPIPEVIVDSKHVIEVQEENSNNNEQNSDDFAENEEQYSTIKRSPHNKTNSLASPDEPVAAPVQEQKTSAANNAKNGKVNGESSDMVTEEDIIYQDVLSDGGLKARALYDYQAADESEITFDPSDIITHIDQIDEGWWQGLGPDGTYGLFPANYVELIN